MIDDNIYKELHPEHGSTQEHENEQMQLEDNDV
jgi:hypothetical protein